MSPAAPAARYTHVEIQRRGIERRLVDGRALGLRFTVGGLIQPVIEIGRFARCRRFQKRSQPFGNFVANGAGVGVVDHGAVHRLTIGWAGNGLAVKKSESGVWFRRGLRKSLRTPGISAPLPCLLWNLPATSGRHGEHERLCKEWRVDS